MQMEDCRAIYKHDERTECTVAPRSTAADDDAGGGSAADEIVSALQHRILVGEAPVGSWLRHSTLAEEFGTSRTPIREALRVLASRGIVTIVPNRGAQVNGHSSRDIRELGEIRAELEGFAAALAAERINDEQLQRLHSAWDGYQQIIDKITARTKQSAAAQTRETERWTHANDDFHNVIMEASGNRQLVLAIEDIHRRYPKNTAFVAYSQNSRLLRRNLAEHKAISDAITAHDSRGARKAMTAHILHSIDATVRWAEDHQQMRGQGTT